MTRRHRWLPFRKLERRELASLLIGLSACVLLWGFFKLGSFVTAGGATAIDTAILRSVRQADDPSKLVGPAWIESALLDLTAIGSKTVLGLVVLAVSGFMLLQHRYRTAAFILATAATGDIANSAVKELFGRPRPTVVPHLREVMTPSFPSGHAMESAIIYLTLGAMLMRLVDTWFMKAYCMGLAILATLLVGISRVYLGVHYPTDVVGGWMFGFLWASLCWLIAQHFEVEIGVSEERQKSKT